MKCALRKVDKGIVATIDERPKLGDCYITPYGTIGERSNYFSSSDIYDTLYKSDHKIIASNFGVGMELVAHYIGFEPEFNINGVLELNKEYNYSIVDGKVVVEL